MAEVAQTSRQLFRDAAHPETGIMPNSPQPMPWSRQPLPTPKVSAALMVVI